VLLIVFTLSMFVSATLLFWVEPMLAKMALPLLGGTPAVWNTCLVFFQMVLLMGYLYAHAATKWLGRRTQVTLHIALVLSAIVVLPVRIPSGWEPPAQGSPVLWILGMLSVTVGLPFFLLSSSTPIMQRWFADSGHKGASDPYFLYAASNMGSMAGLLGYPLVLEPELRLSVQSQFWSYGYALFIGMTMICGALVWRSQRQPIPDIAEPATQAGEIELRNVWPQRIRWIGLAFVPSSLMMGVTTVLTTDVPAIPLFWVLPLAIYLLSFALVFGRRQSISHAWLVRTAPFLLAVSLIVEVFKLNLPLLVLFPLYLLTLFQVAMVCHGELAIHRPEVSRLTEFYLWISVGGVLGGIFNALVAPVVFSTVLEFPLVLILAALLRPSPGQPVLTADEERKEVRRDLLLPLALGLCWIAVMFGLPHAGPLAGRVAGVLFFPMLGFAVILCLIFGWRPMRVAVSMAVIFAGSLMSSGAYGQAIWTGRNFFGVLRVTNSSNGELRYLIMVACFMDRKVSTPREAVSPFRTTPARGRQEAFFERFMQRRSTEAVGTFANPGGRWWGSEQAQWHAI
jgi:hypothetical protein